MKQKRTIEYDVDVKELAELTGKIISKRTITVEEQTKLDELNAKILSHGN
jgi:hypothetical protein